MMRHWLSPAKLNLFLYVTGRREDNYHNLQTLFQFIQYYDQLTFTIRQDEEIKLVTPFANVAHDDNLIVIAARKLQAYATQKKLGAEISIDKKIPMGGGLGGASSNAATVLIALNHLWGLNLSSDTLLEIGRTIGADVPIFLYGKAAFADGIGDHFYPANIDKHWYLVTCPSIEISTATVFNDPELVRSTPEKSLEELESHPFCAFKNDCEPVVRRRYPEIDAIINHLSQYAPTRLTGTGSSLFTQCESERHAMSIQKRLDGFNVQSFITKSMNSAPRYSLY